MFWLENWQKEDILPNSVFFFYWGLQWIGRGPPALPYRGFPDSSAGKESACSAGDPSSIPGLGRSTAKGVGYSFQYSWSSLLAQLVKNPPAMLETWVWSLEPWVGKIPWRREKLPIQYAGLENSTDCVYSSCISPCKELDTTKRLSLHFTYIGEGNLLYSVRWFKC